MNKNADERDMLLFGEPYNKEKYMGGIRHFSGLDAKTAEKLIELGFLDEEDYQNCSPTAGELIDFIKEHEDFTAFGYAVSPERIDYRVSLEGIESEKEFESIEQIEDFVGLCRHADEFNLNPPYAWWD